MASARTSASVSFRRETPSSSSEPPSRDVNQGTPCVQPVLVGGGVTPSSSTSAPPCPPAGSATDTKSSLGRWGSPGRVASSMRIRPVCRRPCGDARRGPSRWPGAGAAQVAGGARRPAGESATDRRAGRELRAGIFPGPQEVFQPTPFRGRTAAPQKLMVKFCLMFTPWSGWAGDEHPPPIRAERVKSRNRHQGWSAPLTEPSSPPGTTQGQASEDCEHRCGRSGFGAVHTSSRRRSRGGAPRAYVTDWSSPSRSWPSPYSARASPAYSARLTTSTTRNTSWTSPRPTEAPSPSPIPWPTSATR